MLKADMGLPKLRGTHNVLISSHDSGVGVQRACLRDWIIQDMASKYVKPRRQGCQVHTCTLISKVQQKIWNMIAGWIKTQANRPYVQLSFL